jgi:predicted Zn finger-like uncharacterized protein
VKKKEVYMLISCPKCNAVYQVTAESITPEGKRFKCAECHNIWTVYPEDAKNMEPETTPIKPQKTETESAVQAPKVEVQSVPTPKIEPQHNDTDADLNEMFHRLQQDTKGLFNDNPKVEVDKYALLKRRLKFIFSPLMINCSIALFIILSTLFIGYKNRYEIVGYIPILEDFYDKFNMESIYAGRDVIFQDVEVKHTERRGQHFIEIYGQIYNKGKRKSQVLPIRAIMRNMQGEIAAQETKILTMRTLEPKFSSIFLLVLENKTADAKKITLTFDPVLHKKIVAEERAKLAMEKAKEQERLKNIRR